jgi:hypothetical protein
MLLKSVKSLPCKLATVNEEERLLGPPALEQGVDQRGSRPGQLPGYEHGAGGEDR